jgi:glycosyltransferase involved in cell wall biosynthesis
MASIRSTAIRFIEDIGRARDDERIVINPYITECLGERLNGRRWNIENPVHPDYFSVVRRPDLSGFLYVGRVSPRKGIHELIEIYSRYRALGGTEPLEIVGSAPNVEYEREMLELAKRLVPTGDICFSGPQNRDYLLNRFSRVKTLVLFSRQETAPLVVSEAMAAGVPVIAYGICGVPYMINDGQTGSVISPGDHEGAARALMLSGGESGDGRNFSENARKEALSRFEVGKVTAKTIAVYRAAVG